jgi:hypothetical protein
MGTTLSKLGTVLIFTIMLASTIGASPANARIAAKTGPLPDVVHSPVRKVVRSHGIDVHAACRWQYGGGAHARMVGQSWRDWRCVTRGGLRGVSFHGYCRAAHGHGRNWVVVSATHNVTGPWTATSWRCRVESPRWS